MQLKVNDVMLGFIIKMFLSMHAHLKGVGFWISGTTI